uniref:Uncharacterized protein n=1 Tax=Aegilops tauschii subsp. strangulata TaxID=200361 RepID=A0A453HMS6_AEGTS
YFVHRMLVRLRQLGTKLCLHGLSNPWILGCGALFRHPRKFLRQKHAAQGDGDDGGGCRAKRGELLLQANRRA